MARNVKDLLNRILGQQQDSWQVQLLTQWETIIGTLKTRVQLLRIHDDTLVLGVSDSCWMQELFLLTPLLLQTINQSLDKPRIKQLRFKALGNQAEKKQFSQQPRYSKKAAPLSTQEEKALKTITDPELAKAFKEYLDRCKE